MEKQLISWPKIAEVIEGIPVPKDYHIDVVGPSEIDGLIAKIKTWYPEISVGAESCHIDRDFYHLKVNLKGVVETRPVWVAGVKFKGEFVAIYSAEYNVDSNWLGGKLISISAEHRHLNLGYAGGLIFVRMGHLIKAAMCWATSTLTHPYSQNLMEKCGFQIAGLIPAWDRDSVNGTPKYVTEALYVKVLADESECQQIDDKNLTPKTRDLMRFLKGLNLPAQN